MTRIDHVSTQGIALRSPDVLYRLLGGDDVPVPRCELLVYDADGVRQYRRLDGVADPHDILVVGNDILIVNTLANEIVRLSDDGNLTSEWRGPGEDDAWHVNSLCERDGEIFFTVFGDFRQHRAWSKHPSHPDGMILALSSGEPVVRGLTQPHSLRWLDGHWMVCNSMSSELLQLDRAGRQTASLKLQKYVRGFAANDEFFFVGESATRRYGHAETYASVAVVSRADWSVIERIPVPTREIYDILIVPPEVQAAASVGFRTVKDRTKALDQYCLFTSVGVQPERLWAISDPLPQTSMQARLEFEMPRQMYASESRLIPCTVANLGNAILTSAPPNPVQICYRWTSADGALVGSGEWIHTDLPASLLPTGSVRTSFRIAAPGVAASYQLSVTLLQENVAWFDDVDPKNGRSGVVEVVPRVEAQISA